MASGKSNFCILLFAYKSMWLPGIRQKRCCRLIGRHTCRTCGEVWPRGQNQHPFTQVPAATSFDQGVKGRKTPIFPGAKQKTPAAFQLVKEGGVLLRRSAFFFDKLRRAALSSRPPVCLPAMRRFIPALRGLLLHRPPPRRALRRPPPAPPQPLRGTPAPTAPHTARRRCPPAGQK